MNPKSKTTTTTAETAAETAVDTAVSSADVLLGSRLDGRYSLTRRIGKTRGGTLYEAIREDIGQTVTVSVASEETDRADFIASWRATGAVQHPNVVPVYGAGAADPSTPAFFVLESVQGRPLRALLEADVLEPARVYALVRQLCSALAAAHAAGVYHQDLSVDVAFARPTPHGHDHLLLLGFRGAPEASGGAVAGAPSPDATFALNDVEGLGRIAFELLSGARWRDHNMAPDGNLDWPTHVARSVPSAFRDVIEAYLSPQDLRPASALEALRLLDTINPRSLVLADPLVSRPTRKTSTRMKTADNRHLRATARRPSHAPATLTSPSPQPPAALAPTIARAMLSVGDDFQAVAQVTAANIRVIALRVFGADLDIAAGSLVRLTVADPGASQGRTGLSGAIQEIRRHARGRAVTVVVALDRRSRGGRYQRLLSLWYGP